MTRVGRSSERYRGGTGPRVSGVWYDLWSVEGGGGIKKGVNILLS